MKSAPSSIAATPPQATASAHSPEVRDLLQFLAANADVATADGDHRKADRFRSFVTTVRNLAATATP